MATITKRTNKDGSIRYKAQIRIKRKGKIIHSESETFSSQAVAKKWAKKRELELDSAGALDAIKHRDVKLKHLISRYINEYGGGFGESKSRHLKQLTYYAISEISAVELKSHHYVDHIFWRLKTPNYQGVIPKPCSVNNDLIWIRRVLRTARPAWGVPVDLQELEDASMLCRQEGLTGKADSRDRRVEIDELNSIMKFYDKRDQHTIIPMKELVLMAIFSGRRAAEITRIRWDDLDEDDKTILVRDMKHPGKTIGNNIRVSLTDEALALIKRQEKKDEKIFPYNSNTMTTIFGRDCKVLGIKNLRFHDFRHEAASMLFERGWQIHEVALVTGHQSWTTLKRYTHLQKLENFDKYKNWEWSPLLKN